MLVDMTIAIDAMGGDQAPEMTIKGVAQAASENPNVHFILFGDEKLIDPLLSEASVLQKRVTVHHTDQRITSDMKPSYALRSSKHSSMRLAIECASNGEAKGVVSAGNTGAYMALAKMILKTLEGIDRPAITAVMPSSRGKYVMLDLGANIECTIENIVQFALMGEVFAEYVLGIKKPSIGLLNVGVEDLKGNATVKAAQRVLRESGQLQNFYGFIEGDDIAAGTTDVVVTDGFTGNISLKTMEGTAKLLNTLLQHQIRRSFLSRFGYLFMRGAVKELKAQLDPRNYNGAIFLGLNGIAVKSHGGTDVVGFANAIKVVIEMISNGVNNHIREELASLRGKSPHIMRANHS
jgi:glycerol-3-phosphate acyltransferase PlsX